jgi:hypothetical protein
LLREECRRSRQGKEVGERRCGKAIEAKPSSCQIEPSEAAWAAIEHADDEEIWRTRGE